MIAASRTKLKLLAVSVLLVPLLVAVAEIAARLLTPRIDPLAVFVSSPQLRSDTQGEKTGGMFEFDPLLCWRLKADLRGVWWDFTPVSTNAQNLRMDGNLSAKKGVRVVVLGDSVTFGYRVPVAPHRDQPQEFDPAEKPYPRLLEESLRAKFPGRDLEVLPLACPGYTSWQGLAWLKRDIAALQPDLVIACFGWNDVRAAGLPDRATMPGNGTQLFVRRLIGNSQLLLSLAVNAAKRQPIPLHPPPPEPRSSADEYVAHFLEMAATCARHHAWFGILLPVYRDPNTPGIDPPGAKGSDPASAQSPGNPSEGKRMTTYRDRLREAATAHKIPHLEIPELTEQSWPENEALFGERIHPNAAGHRLIAERMLDFISPHIGEGK